MAKKKKANSRPVTPGKNSNQKQTESIPPVSTNSTVAGSDFSKKQARNLGLILAFILLVLGALLYGRTIGYDFALDDQIVYSKNRFVQKGWSGINEIMTKETFSGYFKDQQNLLSGSRYRPLSLVTFAAEVGLWGGGTKAAHTINWLLYVLSSFMLYVVFVRMLREFFTDKWRHFIAAIIAVLFLLHPLHVEVVANIKGRDEILCLLFALFSLDMAYRWIDKKKIGYLGASLLSGFLSLLAKESSIILPVAIPAILWVTRPQMKPGKLVAAFISLSVIAAIYMLVRYEAVGYFLSSGAGTEDRILMNNPYLTATPERKHATIAYVILMYFKLFFYPSPLTHDYYPWHIPLRYWSDPAALSGALVMVGLTAWAIWAFIKRKYPAGPIVWIVLSLLLISNLFINVGTTMNERFMYFASFGFFALMGYLLAKLGNGKWKWLTYTIVAYFAVFGFVKSNSRIPDWKDDFTLNESGVKVSPNSARANLFMGVSYFQRGRDMTDQVEKKKLILKADSLFRRSLEILPDYSYAQNMVTGSAAELYLMDGDINKLFSTFKSAMMAQPGLIYARQFLKYLHDSGKKNEVALFLTDLMNELQKQGRGNDAQDIYTFTASIYPQKQLPADTTKQTNIQQNKQIQSVKPQ
jgi:hypothetical protein